VEDITEELLPKPRLAGNVDTLPTEIGEPGLGDGGR